MNIKYLESFKKPKIYVTYEAFRKMRNYVSIHDEELGWFGTVEKDKDNEIFVITDVFLPEQEVSSTYNEIGADTMMKMAGKLTSEQISKIKCYGHSHVDMTVSPSGTDKTQVEELTEGSSWFITIINNKNDDWYVAFNDYSKGIAFEYDELPLYITTDESIKKEIKDKVKKKPTVHVVSKGVSKDYDYGYGRYGGYGGYYDDWRNKKKSRENGEKHDKVSKEDIKEINRIKKLDNLLEYYVVNSDNPEISETLYFKIIDLSNELKSCDTCPYGLEEDGTCSVLELATATSKYGAKDEICPMLLDTYDFYSLYEYADEDSFNYGVSLFLEDRSIEEVE